jgi:hypothetical protein
VCEKNARVLRLWKGDWEQINVGEVVESIGHVTIL